VLSDVVNIWVLGWQVLGLLTHRACSVLR